MPIYPGRREGIWRITAYGGGKQVERSVRGSRAVAEREHSELQREMAYAREPCDHSMHYGRTRSRDWPEVPGVYFLQVGDRGPIKIGVADNVRSRCRSHQSSCPYKLRLLLVLGDGDRAIERTIHEHFDRWRLRGEWFQPSQYLLDCIAGEMRSLIPDQSVAAE